MKLYPRIITVLLFLAIAFGLIWAVAKYMATPTPSGEAYQLVPDWPKLPAGIELGQVSGVGVDSDGDVSFSIVLKRFGKARN